MNANRKAYALVVAVWLVAGYQHASQGAVIGMTTLVKDPAGGVPFASPDAALGAPWVSYALALQSTAGELIGGVDVEITGQLHQRWNFDVDTETFAPTANSTNQSNGDSHLRAVTSALFGSGPSEDNSGAGSPLSDTANSDYGVGSYLRGA